MVQRLPAIKPALGLDVAISVTILSRFDSFLMQIGQLLPSNVALIKGSLYL